MTTLHVHARTLLVSLGWSAGLTGILLISLYQKPIIGPFEVLLILLLGMAAGLVLVTPSNAISSCFLSFAIAGILTYLILSIPGFSGSMGSDIAAEFLYSRNIVAVFRNLVFPPFALFAGLAGSLAGAYLAERWDLAS